MIFCTLSDYNYMPRGLALYLSIKEKYSKPFKLKYLCLDDKCYYELNKLDLPEVDTFLLSDLEDRDDFLKEAKNFKPGAYGDAWANYCWLLTPYFVHYILTRNLMYNEMLVYCDADIFFFDTPDKLLNNKAVGIHTHRYGGEFTEAYDPGWYNVGVMTFNPTDKAVDIAESWKLWLLNPHNKYAKQYGKCGDQKYLELFPKLWGMDDICILDEDLNIGHIAPWNFDKGIHHHPDKKWHIVYKRKTQPVVFFHFARFWSDGKTYVDCGKGEWNPTEDVNILKYYEHYFQYICQGFKMIEA